MPFSLTGALANHSESAFIRWNSSHEDADTKSDRLGLSSSATVPGDDRLGSWNAALRAA